MEKEQPNYYAIIPAGVRYDKELKDKAKLLYGEISSLSNKEGKCWATNSYFAELYDVSNETISRLISDLVDRGYIERVIEYKEGTREIKCRYLRINTPLLTKTSIPIDEKINTPIDENVKENNTSILIINKNKVVVEEYENEIGMLTPYQSEILFSYLDDLSEEMIIEAIHRASAMNKKSLAYVEGILKSWVQNGYKVLADIQDTRPKKTTSYHKSQYNSLGSILNEMEMEQKLESLYEN